MAKHLLLFAATTGYQIRVFAAAARRLGVDVTLATDRCHIMEDPWGDRAIAVKFDRIAESLDTLRGLQVDGVAAVGDRPALLAAEAAAMFGVPFHSPAAARACIDKNLSRQLFQAAGLRVPSFLRAALDSDPAEIAARAPYPCVLKPLGLSASRGVIRADDPAAFVAAFRRIARMGERELQVESYIPGREFAVEGVITAGKLQVIAIFDKPDPLDGPFFEETLYITPSREPEEVRQALIDTTARAAEAIGLRHGPVHAELRYNADGAWILEVHARPIGGLCARAVRLADGIPLEEMILVHAVGGDVRMAALDGEASGVMMIPIPKGGVFQSVDGMERALAIPGIEDIEITAVAGQLLVPLPEGASYLGFIFARGERPEDVEQALRRSHAELTFQIATALETFRPSS
ncbi:MAG: ATP-dependent carboxylate-amine ligase domain protein ATP-grasp [Candidatus Solibacter sp.]|nr:ATP-dependent carboxylate-amine ligase domain protein ATP-grasp [Candidatus Solibacter sp.]